MGRGSILRSRRSRKYFIGGIYMSGCCKKCKRWAVLHPIHRLCYKCFKNSYIPTQSRDKWWMK